MKLRIFILIKDNIASTSSQTFFIIEGVVKYDYEKRVKKILIPYIDKKA